MNTVAISVCIRNCRNPKVIGDTLPERSLEALFKRVLSYLAMEALIGGFLPEDFFEAFFLETLCKMFSKSLSKNSLFHAPSNPMEISSFGDSSEDSPKRKNFLQGNFLHQELLGKKVP